MLPPSSGNTNALKMLTGDTAKILKKYQTRRRHITLSFFIYNIKRKVHPDRCQKVTDGSRGTVQLFL
jgi:hypothetical protein